MADELFRKIDIIGFWWEPDVVVQNETGPVLSARGARRVADGPRVYSFIGGSAHAVLGLVEHPRAFDFVLPSAPDLPLDPARALLPADGVRAALVHLMAPYASLLRHVETTARGEVIQVSPPPPVEDANRIAPHVPWDYYPGQPRVVAPALLRYKLWRMSCELLEQDARAHGFGWMEPPPGTADERGFLLPEFDADGVHAGPAYGRRVLQQIGVL